MAEWIETYRGIVNAWECDVVQHFTIAYYFDRFADATRNLLDLAELGDAIDLGLRNGPARSYATFQHELRAGAGFHIRSAVTGVDAGALRLGHQVVDSTSGETVTWFAETYPVAASVPASLKDKLASLVAPWPGPRVPDRQPARAAHGPITARDRVKPWEIDEVGVMSLPAHVHRFSAAGMQLLAALGMTATYVHEQKRGFSTFELDLTRFGTAAVGDIVDVRTWVSHLGNSSLRIVHRMTGANGSEIATLVQSGVHLDMQARRSTAIPDELRAKIKTLLVRDA